MIWMLVHLLMLNKFFSLSLPDVKHNFDGLWRLIIWFFLCPQMIWILFVFLLRVHCIAPRWSAFQGVSRSVDVILVKDFANSVNVLEPNLIFQRSYLFKSNCWKENKEMSILKSFFGNQAYLVKDPTHIIQNIQSFDCLVFWNRNWPVVRLKWLFSWFFVSVLTFDHGYIFWRSAMRWPSVNFKENKSLKPKLEDFSRNGCFSFLAPILSACIITSSLIHEATTLMEKLFKFWDRHLSVQIAYLIKKSFLKHVMQVMVHGYERKEFQKLKRCLRVLKT